MTNETKVTTEETTPTERNLSLILNYQQAADAAADAEKGNMRIVSDELLADALSGKSNDEEAKKLQAELGNNPTLVENTPQIISDLYDGFSEVLTLYNEIENKRKELLDVNTMLKDKLQKLKEDNKITINEEVFNSNEESVVRYVQLVEELIKEVRSEVELFAMIIQCKKIYLAHHEGTENPHNPLEMLISKIKNTKRYVKNVRRDINVSYSRYSFGLNAQMKQIAYFEMAAYGGQK